MDIRVFVITCINLFTLYYLIRKWIVVGIFGGLKEFGNLGILGSFLARYWAIT